MCAKTLVSVAQGSSWFYRTCKKLKPSRTPTRSFMKKFEGSWHIQPFTERTLHELDMQQQQLHLPGPLAALKLPSPLAALQSMRE